MRNAVESSDLSLLFDRVEEVTESSRNKANKKFWYTDILWLRDIW